MTLVWSGEEGVADVAPVGSALHSVLWRLRVHILAREGLAGRFGGWPACRQLPKWFSPPPRLGPWTAEC
jgi:hypothetical protein